MRLHGRDEVHRRRRRLQQIFKELDGAGLGAELMSHYARYLCVLVSGYAEQSVKELVRQYCRTRSNEAIQKYVGSQLKRMNSIDRDKLRQLLESFDPAWWPEVEVKSELGLEALNSVSTLRDSISHGGDSGVTMSTMSQYFDQIDELVNFLCGLLDPSDSK